MRKWTEVIDTMLDSAHELSYSLDKFITYAEHVLKELEAWKAFSQNWYKGAWYALIIESHTKVRDSIDVTISIDKVIELLCDVLLSDILDTNKKKYTQVYELYLKLIKFGDEKHNKNHKLARKRAIELFSWKLEVRLAQKVRRVKNETVIDINSPFILFNNFFSLLWEISKNPSSIYVPGFEDSIKPQFTEQVDMLFNFIDSWEKSEIQSIDQRNLKWKVRDDTLTNTEISQWYDTLREWNIENIVLNFWMFLLKKWELETLPQKVSIVRNLLDLTRKISKNRHSELLGIIHLESYNNSRQ